MIFYLFYLLILAQIALGVYSLYEGFVWFRMVRQRLSSHAGFYTPAAALIVPCKGAERGLEENLMAMTRFDYPNYELYCVLATSLDPALKVIERVKAASSKPVHIVIAGPPEDCSEKVYNLTKAVASLPESVEVYAFTDSDVRASRTWLTKLIAPLQDSRIGATTAYRWIIPNGNGGDGFASALASVWNASVATVLGKRENNFCWGGGTAIRKTTFKDANVLESWKGSVSDDFGMTYALEVAGKDIVFCSECFAPTMHPWTFQSLLEFTNRQILITRVHSPRRWKMGAIAHISYSLTVLFGFFMVLYGIIDVHPWGNLLLLTLAVPMLAAMKGALRTIAITEAIPEWRSAQASWSWIWAVLAPIIPFLFTYNFLMSLITKRIVWRGIRYELLGPNTTRIIRR
ncbi:MAG: glycosyltransferase [Candidatus Acidiferrales bacterium]|jgi:ceramide glucosyltransferase